MAKKYLCPKHREDTPSANAYSDHWYCFGCGKRGPLSELGIPAGERIEITYQEDLAASLGRIRALPKKPVRGFELHSDSTGYYLLWADGSYYKKRIEGAESGNKYRGPSGHRKPAFVVQRGVSQCLALVEGEFNALSLAACEPDCDVISPGGAGDFYSSTGRKHFPEYAKYETVYIVTDADAAGAQAAIETKAALVALGCPDVRIHLVEKDFNQILVEEGKEALRETAKRMGL